ncbi:hypothetical protein LTS18_001651, partial [Coniosporium uncinatum]
FQGFLNQAWVQRATGAPHNYTVGNNSIYAAFRCTGGYARGGNLEDLPFILNSGVKVALVHGDRELRMYLDRQGSSLGDGRWVSRCCYVH